MASGRRKGSGSRGKKKRKGGGLRAALGRLGRSREVSGGLLLGLGLFYTAAFVTGRGAFLGEIGRLAATHLLGPVGLSLAPLVAAVGLGLLLRRLPVRRLGGVGLLLFAVSGTLAGYAVEDARLSPEGGGILGGGFYEAVRWLAGDLGAVLALGALYLFGASMLSGVGLQEAAAALRSGLRGVAARLRARRRAARSGGGARRSPAGERDVGRQDAEETRCEPGGREEEASDFEVVLPRLADEDRGFPEREESSGEYTPPPFSLLEASGGSPEHDVEGTSRRLTRALRDLGVEAQVVRAVVGPRVTRYELRLGSGVKVSKVKNLQQDIAYALAATEVRILAPIPGKSAVGVEVPNTRPAKVTLGDIFREYPEGNDWALPVGLGKDISGRAVFVNLAEMPHLLVAGTTGSGKSVMLNSLLTSLLLTTDPRQVKMVLIDPKRVELSQFSSIPHLITPVVTDVKKAANALGWAVAEMERRYEVLEGVGVRSLEGYNARTDTPMPYVVIVIDELADLMMTAAAKVEDAVIRIAQKARAVGIHLVVATQRPSVDVITGMIKANIPSRIAFAVSSQVDSRVILDSPGAEALLGMGDMLFKPVSASRPSRIQGAFISEAEVERVVRAAREAARGGEIPAGYIEEVTEPQRDAGEDEEPEDELLPEAASFVVATRQASVSAVQRRFRVGYSRAGRIIDALERKGIVGPYEGSKSRAVVATEADLAQIFNLDRREGAGDEAEEGW
ncbi:DNA translocase SpoIIIE [Rubrobacter xylanophilus DSM 9941]|uniref:DNA translocase FtsK n=1 Tax=Rubrobacter xylanophilus TaxID=49319 RepID=UPI001C63F540|nr:DNA translocase FtsK [Rubrobacter xylanophilus]QYJ14656.1 DNA translocase SpoIIIE [Rubrobacter xylanophilus DSM 9941]